MTKSLKKLTSFTLLPTTKKALKYLSLKLGMPSGVIIDQLVAREAANQQIDINSI